MLPLAVLALLFLMAALSFAWGVRGQRALTVATAELPEGGKVAPDGRLERVYGVMMWTMVICGVASLGAAGVGLSVLF
jgi:hypothetical protein